MQMDELMTANNQIVVCMESELDQAKCQFSMAGLPNLASNETSPHWEIVEKSTEITHFCIQTTFPLHQHAVLFGASNASTLSERNNERELPADSKL